MHSVTARINSVLAFGAAALCLLTFLCFLSSLPFDPIPKVQFNLKNVKIGNVTEYGISNKKVDLALVSFDLSTDLECLFNWNVKQVFLYLIAEYSTSNNPRNQVVIWDKIIKKGQPALLKLTNRNSKYHFFDDGSGLSGHPNVTFSLHWNTIPMTGLLFLKSVGHQSFEFPSE
eukprot:Sdes_comp20827_c0_seq3m17411